MTPSTANVGPRVVKAAIAVILLVVVVMTVMSYWGTYRNSKNDQEGSVETTPAAESTATPEGEASPEGGEDGGEEASASESKGTVVVLIDGLNFRTTPSKSGDLISGLDKGVKLEYLETADGWYKVRTSDGKVGYVSASNQYTELQQ